MKKTLLIILLLSLIGLTGCASEKSFEKMQEDIKNIENSIGTTTKSDIESYVCTGNVTFVPISYMHIKDSTINGLDILQYVDLDTGVMYVYTEKYGSGYGTTLEVLVDADGNPRVYEDLDTLRTKYNWTE